MKKPHVNFFRFVFLILFIFISTNVFANNLENIKKAIKEKNANWTAGENWVTKLSPEERSNLFGAVINPSDSNLAPLISLPKVGSLPPVFNWRNNYGNWITPVKQQGLCGSCWDFSAVAQIEAWWKIYNNNPDSIIDLSEQYVLSCGNAGSCDGGSSAYALEFVKNVGIPLEECFHYSANDSIPCSNACSNWEDEAIKIPGWGWITKNEALIDNIKNAVFIHPLSAYLDVYTDLEYYSGGVYQHVSGKFEAGHMVLIVGWNDEEESWICKNSWGTNWGDSGYFRIKWGDCKIGTFSPFIWNGVTGSSLVSASPQQVDLSLTAGNTTVQELILTNRGQDMLGYSATDFNAKKLFHPDDFLAWKGLSWWSGDTSIGGYNNDDLQYLETPVLDLSTANMPQLNFMGFWAVEDTTGASSFPPYDGWDGCNVWVSTDAGRSFNVAYPASPAYNCTNLYSFSNPEGWNLGVVPGWGGSNGGWTPVQFDLSSYKSDSVIIRFAFASDEGYCTLDDSSLLGFFIDDIKISDDSTIIFKDNANDINSMKQIGFGHLAADWIEISNSMGQVAANDSATIYIKIDAGNLNPGDYNGTVEIISNDTTLSKIVIPIHLEVTAIVGIDNSVNIIPDRLKLEQNYPNPFNPTTTIKYSVPSTKNSFLGGARSGLIDVQLKVYDILGREVAVLVNEEQRPGYYEVKWNASNQSSGVYFYRFQAGSFIETKKMILLK